MNLYLVSKVSVDTTLDNTIFKLKFLTFRIVGNEACESIKNVRGE